MSAYQKEGESFGALLGGIPNKAPRDPPSFLYALTIELWKHLARRIIATAGVKSLSRMSRAIPLVGAPIGFAFDYAATRSVGECACDYFGPAHDEMVAVTEPV